MIKINLNDYVYVKLNEIGLAILKEYYDKLYKDALNKPEYKPPAIDKEGYSKMQLHTFMMYFGHTMYLSSALPCDIDIGFKPSYKENNNEMD